MRLPAMLLVVVVISACSRDSNPSPTVRYPTAPIPPGSPRIHPGRGPGRGMVAAPASRIWHGVLLLLGVHHLDFLPGAKRLSPQDGRAQDERV